VAAGRDVTTPPANAGQLLDVALRQARLGLESGGIPIGAALFSDTGVCLGAGHNRRIQDEDPSAHAETTAFRAAGRRSHYADTVLATTLAPCWFCSGLVVQFQIPRVVIGDADHNGSDSLEWLRENGVDIVIVDSMPCRQLLGEWIAHHPDLWSEDKGGR
jgi:cytosine/creatinine deaminase